MTIDYQHLYDTAKINPAKMPELKLICKRINAGMPRYKDVAKQLGNGIPWWFIGITHFMEAGGKKDPFLYHLHCGDPLTGRTTHVPKGRPIANPGGGTIPPSAANPYTWEFSALDALKYMKYDKQTKWDLPSCLLLFERFNGMGYNKRGLYSPYLWSYTNWYVKGKFTGDGKFDPNALSKQPGTAAILKVLNP
jgi:lysozyme family protein